MQKSKLKKTSIFFYYLNFIRHKDTMDSTSYDMSTVITELHNMLEHLSTLSLKERSYDLLESSKVIWLDSFKNNGGGNFDIIFKSVKYNHVRNERDIKTMKFLGGRRKPEEGDEEKTHLCIRYSKGQLHFLAVCESNYYGITIGNITDYLTQKFKCYFEEIGGHNFYTVSYSIMPSDDFLTEINNTKKVSLLTLSVEKQELKNEFLSFAGRGEIKETVELIIKPKNPRKGLPNDLVREYYNQMRSSSKVRAITVKGISKSNNDIISITTDLIKMKRSLQVICEIDTEEVNSIDFFMKANEFLSQYNK